MVFIVFANRDSNTLKFSCRHSWITIHRMIDCTHQALKKDQVRVHNVRLLVMHILDVYGVCHLVRCSCVKNESFSSWSLEWKQWNTVIRISNVSCRQTHHRWQFCLSAQLWTSASGVQHSITYRCVIYWQIWVTLLLPEDKWCRFFCGCMLLLQLTREGHFSLLLFLSFPVIDSDGRDFSPLTLLHVIWSNWWCLKNRLCFLLFRLCCHKCLHCLSVCDRLVPRLQQPLQNAMVCVKIIANINIKYCYVYNIFISL